jgi:SAM-dependent methyltransferase
MANIMQAPSAGNQELSYVELLAYLGITRHLGGWAATTELSQLCEIGRDKWILDVGCGVGRTSCIFAKQYGARVTGIDLSPRMVEWSRQRAQQEGVADKAEFRRADAQQLPFEDGLFDAVVTESVLVFVPDRHQALAEFVRVTKPGGFIGLNETCWLKTPIPQEVLDFVAKGYFSGARPETAAGWQTLLTGAGVRDAAASVHQLTARGDTRDRLKWFGVRGVATNLYRMISLAVSSPATRQGIQRVLAMSRHSPANLYEYLGYGIYAGRT